MPWRVDMDKELGIREWFKLTRPDGRMWGPQGVGVGHGKVVNLLGRLCAAEVVHQVEIVMVTVEEVTDLAGVEVASVKCSGINRRDVIRDVEQGQTSLHIWCWACGLVQGIELSEGDVAVVVVEDLRHVPSVVQDGHLVVAGERLVGLVLPGDGGQYPALDVEPKFKRNLGDIFVSLLPVIRRSATILRLNFYF